MKKIIPAILILLACVGCQPEFKVWRDYNSERYADVLHDSLDFNVTPSGVLYRVIYPVYHTGYVPKPESTVLVNYTGWLVDGTLFEKADSAMLDVEMLIPGWQEALCKMTDGEKWRIYVPSELGYGPEGSELGNGNFSVPPYSTLIFDIELVDVINY